MADLSVFKRLQKLFSTDVIVRNIGGKKLKVVDTNRIQYATDRNSLRDRFNRLRSSTYNLHNRDMSMAYQASRLELFRDYDTMDMDPILASALDIYADECVGENEMGDVLTIQSDDENIKAILENLFYEILNIEFNLWSWTRNMPVKFDSIIPLLDGRNITIKELSEEIKSGKEIWVYSCQDGTNKTVPGKVVWCDKNYTSEKIVQIELDDDSILECSPEHPFILRDGTEVRADELMESDSLMPFYRKLSEKKNKCDLDKYEMILSNESNEYDFTHRIVANELNVKSYGEPEVIHHVDFNKYNNEPANLQKMDFFEHKKFHADHCKAVLHTPEVTKKRLDSLQKYLRSDSRKKRLSDEMRGKRIKYFDEYNASPLHSTHNKIRSDVKRNMWKDPKKRKAYCENMKNKWNDKLEDILQIEISKVSRGERGAINHDELLQSLKNNNNFISEWESVNSREFKRLPSRAKDGQRNHKVKSVSVIAEKSDVYCMTVVGPNGERDRHNFAILGKNKDGTFNENSGVFTKNCKYGDFFLKMEISPEYGVYSVEPLSAYEVTRIEGIDPENKNYVKFQHDGAYGGMEYENYEVAHFRLISDSNFLPYGRSQIEPARRVWKQLSLMEDAMLIHRIMRAPERRIFYVDIGNIPPAEVDTYMERLINKMKKVPFIDEKTGDYNLRFNLQNMNEDFYMPVRGGDSGTKIENLGGLDWTGTEDLEYIRNKMMAALKIPKAFLGYDETISGKATLAAEDVRFAKTIQRIQKIIASELTKIAILHLYVQGYTDASMINFELRLSNPSTIFKQEKVALWGDMMSVAGDMIDRKLFSKRHVYEHLFELSPDETDKISNEIITDTKELFRLNTIENEGTDPAAQVTKVATDAEEEGGDEFGGGGDFGGGDFGGDMGGGDELFEGDIPTPGEDNRPEEVKKDQDNLKKPTTTQGLSDRRKDADTKDLDILGKRSRIVRGKTEEHEDDRFNKRPNFSISEELENLKKKIGNTSKSKKSLLDENNILKD